MDTIHKWFFVSLIYINDGVGFKKIQPKIMMALQSIYFGDKILFTLNNKNLEIIREDDKKKKIISIFLIKKIIWSLIFSI